MENKVVKIGSRKSELALIQTNYILDCLKQEYPDLKYEVVTMETLGDQILDKPLPKIGEKSLFTKELETALLENKVDIVVHSLKDMPTSVPDGLVIGAISKREDPRDALILHSKHRGLSLSRLPSGSVIGTSSLRRTAQLRRKYPQLVVNSIRGNLQTRLRKLDQGLFDGIILAVAGVNRMGWDHRISQVLECDDMLYAVGQGSLGVECRLADSKLYWRLSDEFSTLRAVAERSLMACLGAGCSAPMAVTTEVNTELLLTLTAGVWTLDGKEELIDSLSVNLNEIPSDLRLRDKKNEEGGGDKGLRYCGLAVPEDGCADRLAAAHALGCDLAARLITKGALDVIDKARHSNLTS